MGDTWEQNYYALMRALEQFPEWIPEDLRHLTLAELQRRWDDPEVRERLMPALQKLARAAQPVVDDTVGGIRAARTSLAQASVMLLRAREWVVNTAAAISEVRPLTQFAASYCQPWQRQIGTLHGGAVPPLTINEQFRFMLTGMAVSLRREEERYQRPPLEWISLLIGRMDIPVAILSERLPDMAGRLQYLRDREQDELDLQAEILELLGDRILPDIADRLKELPGPEAAELLKLRLTESYLTVALRHDLIDRKRARWRRDSIEGVSLDASGDTASDASWISREEALAAEQVVDEYLRQSDRPEVDEIIVDGIREETPSGELSTRTGVSARTLRSRRQRLLKWCRDRLGWS